MSWKVIACPECKTDKCPKFLKIEPPCGRMQCQACGHIWWEHPLTKSCKHRKLTKADKAANLEKAQKDNLFI